MKLTGIHYGIILSNLATAFLHLSLFPALGPDPIFLNGFGYLGLLGAYFLPMPFFQQRHKLVWWGMVGYTVLTIILWALLGNLQFTPGTTSATGYYAKAAEVILLVFLWLDRPKS
ncbi:MAG: hypothetical protein ACOYZ8_03565 [Chloroflexota bacterium]